MLTKPATENVEANGRPDDVVATQAWDTHLLRNRSVIVDHFQGQYKSTVECPDCPRTSITFDPLMYLSLPIKRQEKIIEVTLVPETAETPVKYGVKVGQFSPISQLFDELAALSGKSAKCMVLASVAQHLIEREYNNRYTIDALAGKTNLFA